VNLATCSDTVAINGIPAYTSHPVGFELVSCLFRPAQSTFELMINASKNQSEVFVACYNLLGIRLADGAFMLQEGMNTISLPLKPGQAKGVFVIRVMLDGVSKTIKVTGF
jgi:hypothetical protein